MKLLFGHTSPETAYQVDDYPYGFRLRCKIRYWIEYKKGHGYRFCSQTTNPKLSVERWNKPKCGTYHHYAVMTLDESNGHIHYDCLSIYSDCWDRFYANGYYHQLPESDLKLVDALVSYMRRTSPGCWAERDELLQLITEALRIGFTDDQVKAEADERLAELGKPPSYGETFKRLLRTAKYELSRLAQPTVA